MSKEIQLTRGKVAIVDDEDYERVSQYKWYYGNGYAMRKLVRGFVRTTERMQRFIMNPPDGMDVDHINGSKLDNRRSNLRVCTRGQNAANAGKPANNTSGFKGVSWSKSHRKWQAQITHENEKIHLGYFDTPEEAARYYDKSARVYKGVFAQVNGV